MAIEETYNEKQGHWMLARLGKQVLRPGGIALTRVLLSQLKINNQDDLVEFAPGLGLTANMACANHPRSYTGVDRNEEAARQAKAHIGFDKARIVVGDAAATTLPDNYASKVFGEAMLTMHPVETKLQIIKEAVRILKPGGYYGIHELCIQPADISEAEQKLIFKDLGSNMRVHAHPLTIPAWRSLLQQEGFEILSVQTSPMALLEFGRLIQDEGIMRTLKIVFNVLTHKTLRKRILHIREMFRRHQKDIEAVAIVARKI